MSNEEWNELQSKVFAKAFEQVEDGVSAKGVIASLERRRNVWKKFYSIVGKDIEPYNERFSIMDMGRIEYNNRMYLVLRYGLWDFIVIDIETMTCVSQEDGILMAQDDVFDRFKGIHNEDIKYFTFDKLKKKTIKKVLDYYAEEQDVFEGQRKIYYEFYNKDGIRAGLIINFDKTDVMVSINDLRDGRCNYIFLDSNLKVYGASNLTGNKEEIGNMFDGTRDILLPSSLIYGISKDIEDRMMGNGNSFSINKQV